MIYICHISGLGICKSRFCNSLPNLNVRSHVLSCLFLYTPDHLLLDRSPNIEPLISRWELDKFKNCWNTSFRTSKIQTLLYQEFLNLLISQRDMSGPRLGALSNNRWSGSSTLPKTLSNIFRWAKGSWIYYIGVEIQGLFSLPTGSYDCWSTTLVSVLSWDLWVWIYNHFEQIEEDPWSHLPHSMIRLHCHVIPERVWLSG